MGSNELFQFHSQLLALQLDHFSNMKGVMKRALERHDSEQPAAKRKSLVCLACKRKPSGSSDWAAYEKRGRTMAAIGDRCQACEAVWTQAFAYLDWPAFSALQQSEET